MDRLKELQHQVTELQASQLSYVAGDLLRTAQTAGDFRIVAQAFDDLDANALKTLANLLIKNEGAVALLGSTQGGKATFIVAHSAKRPAACRQSVTCRAE